MLKKVALITIVLTLLLQRINCKRPDFVSCESHMGQSIQEWAK